MTCDFVRNNVWLELEIVVYERVLHTEQWKRGASFGSVTSPDSAADFTPDVSVVLITCWGKLVISDVAPWQDFVPDTSQRDNAAGWLKLHFSAPEGHGDEGGSTVATVPAEAAPVVQVRLVQ